MARLHTCLRNTTAYLLLAAAGCREPTQIKLELTTNVMCSDIPSTVIRVGLLADIETGPSVTTTSRCDPATGRIGSLVAVPRGEDDAAIAFRITTTFDQADESCVPPEPGCIEARRLLYYLPYKSLVLPILMSKSCAEVSCGSRTQTCIDGTCRDATVDPTLCVGDQGCGEDTVGGGPPVCADGQLDTGVASSACEPYTCNATGTACLASCTGGVDCKKGYACASGKCVQGTWLRSFGSDDDDSAHALAVQPDGTAFFAALPGTEGVNFGGGVIGPAGYGIVRMDPAGNHQWSRAFVAAGEVKDYPHDAGKPGVVRDLVAGPSTVTVVGESFGGVKFGGTSYPSTGQTDGFAVTFDAKTGNERWIQRLLGVGPAGLAGAALDPDENPVVVGYFGGSGALGALGGSASIGTIPLDCNGLSDAVLSTLASSDGGPVWARAIATTDSFLFSEAGYDVAVAKGHIWLAGTDGNSSGSWLSHHAADGVHTWSKRLGSSASSALGAVAVDGANNVYVSGGMGGGQSLQLDGSVSAKGEGMSPQDRFIVSFDVTGKYRWHRLLGKRTDFPVRKWEELAVDPDGTVYAAVAFKGKIDAGGAQYDSAGDEDVLIASFDRDGKPRWSRRFGGTGADIPTAVALGGGAIYVLGTFSGKVDFENIPLTSKGQSDIFLLRFVPPMP